MLSYETYNTLVGLNIIEKSEKIAPGLIADKSNNVFSKAEDFIKPK